MKDLEFTKVSSKGQVVIPQGIRKNIHLKSGEMLAVTAKDDTILLKKVKKPKIKSWKEASKPFKKAAKQSGLKQEDIEKLIKEVRRSEDD